MKNTPQSYVLFQSRWNVLKFKKTGTVVFRLAQYTMDHSYSRPQSNNSVKWACVGNILFLWICCFIRVDAPHILFLNVESKSKKLSQKNNIQIKYRCQKNLLAYKNKVRHVYFVTSLHWRNIIAFSLLKMYFMKKRHSVSC